MKLRFGSELAVGRQADIKRLRVEQASLSGDGDRTLGERKFGIGIGNLAGTVHAMGHSVEYLGVLVYDGQEIIRW